MARCNATESLERCKTALRTAKADGLENRDAIELVISRLDIGHGELAAAAALLSEAERQRAGRFTVERERDRYIVARSSLRRLLGARLGVRPEAVELVFGKYGKPALAPRFAASALNFNLSHSQGLAVFAFVAGRKIGIDIECVRPIVTADHIVARFFSLREQEAYRALPPQERLLGFFNGWTRKEAFVKAIGDGLNHALDAFDVALAPGEPVRICRVGVISGEACGWTLRSFLPGAGFVGAIVVQQSADETPPRLHTTQVH